MGRHNSISGVDPRYKTHLVASHRSGLEENFQRIGMLGHLLISKSVLSVQNGVLLYTQLIRPMMVYTCPVWRSAPMSGVYRFYNPRGLPLATGVPWYVTGRYTGIWEFRCSPTTSEP
jgi:hypothetical protein